MLSVKELDIIIFTNNYIYSENVKEYFRDVIDQIKIINYDHNDIDIFNKLSKAYFITALPTFVSRTTGIKISGARNLETIVERLQDPRGFIEINKIYDSMRLYTSTIQLEPFVVSICRVFNPENVVFIDAICPICTEEVTKIVVEQCKHAYCEVCYEKMNKCPKCNIE